MNPNGCLKATICLIFCFVNIPTIVLSQNINNRQVRATANRGIWVENGLVDIAENVHLTISLPGNRLVGKLPVFLSIHPRYLEDPSAPEKKIPLNWKKSQDGSHWSATGDYKPQTAGNYYASIMDDNRECYSSFAAWKPGLPVTTFWVLMTAEYHAKGNLSDLYLADVRSGHLPFDYELGLVGEQIFSDDWKPRSLFREAQEETGADVVPFFDGGYFHKLDTAFTKRFNDITQIMSPNATDVSKETYAARNKMLPDPTFHGLSAEQCNSIINGARAYWKQWGFRDFTGISTYSPSHTLIEACRRQGATWISGLFQDYAFHDGSDRWLYSWVQEHYGMPGFPYIVSKQDYRRAGESDQQTTMIFPAQRNLPVWDHLNLHWAALDAQNFRNWEGTTMSERMMDFADDFNRNDILIKNKLPYVISYAIQFTSHIQANRDVLKGLIDRAAKGQLIFAHKRDIQKYFRKHKVQQSPDITCGMPDSELTKGAPEAATKGIQINYEAWWEGPDGKAAFVSNNIPQLGFTQAPYLPIWWFDYSEKPTLSETKNLSKEDLSNVILKIVKDGNRNSILINSQRPISRLPICLWELSREINVSSQWIRKNRAMKVLAPKNQGKDATMWIIRPDIIAGENRIIL